MSLFQEELFLFLFACAWVFYFLLKDINNNILNVARLLDESKSKTELEDILTNINDKFESIDENIQSIEDRITPE